MLGLLGYGEAIISWRILDQHLLRVEYIEEPQTSGRNYKRIFTSHAPDISRQFFFVFFNYY